MNIDRYPYAFCASLLSGAARNKFVALSHTPDQIPPRVCYRAALREQEAAPSASL